VRIIAATNKPLREMIAKGEFREDFYYRINVINVTLPALRDRREDIPLLMEEFLERKCKEKNIEQKTYSKKTLEKMIDYSWPGNIRELTNEVERLVVLAGDETLITPDMISPKIIDKVGGISSASVSSIPGVNINGKMREALEELEALMIKEGLKRCNFNKSRLSKELDISRASLIMKVDKYGLDKRVKKVS
jgi:transcriptional regulator with PAS, ATPase and Fis domain